MNQIDRFKGYIFHEERESLEQLQGRLEDVEKRAIDVAEVLPRSLVLSQEDEERQQALVATLREPVSASIKASVESDPESFANALFPVLGPLIRKTVGEAMRALTERLNRTVEHSFSRRGLKWRWESLRTGTPLADIILRDTLVYRVEQIFLVEREAGLLVAHVQSGETELEQDSDAVSAMLTAIQDFVRDSFGAYEQTDLNTVQIGGRTVWVLYGPRYMLASVFFGAPDAELRTDFHTANEAVHRLLGDSEVLQGTVREDLTTQINALLSPLLTSDSRLGKPSGNDSLSRFAKPLFAFIVVLTLLFTWHLIGNYKKQSKLNALIHTLSAIPGVVVLDQAEVIGQHRVRLLKDPSVKLPDDLLSAAGLSEKLVSLYVQSFQSSDEAVLLEKIRRHLKAPNSISLAWENGVLQISGYASKEWVRRIMALPFTWLGVERVDFSNVEVTSGNKL